MIEYSKALMIEYLNALMIEHPKVLMLKYLKILMIEYHKTNGMDKNQSNNNATKIEEIKKHTSNNCISSLAFEYDASLIDKNRIIETHYIIIGYRPANSSLPSESIVSHREKLDEYNRFLLKILFRLF